MADSKTVPTPRDRKAERRTTPAVFYRQVVAELRKVVWPSQNQLTTYFVVVLVFVAVMMTLTALLDFGLGNLMFKIFAGNG